VFYVDAALVGRRVSLGMRASAQVGFIVEDASLPPIRIINNAASSSYETRRDYVFSRAGTYRMRLAYANGPAEYSVGVREAPEPPTSFLCGTVRDTLSADSIYVCADPAYVQAGHIEQLQAGTVLEFAPGGRLVAGGSLQGAGTSTKPIVLRPRVSAFAREAWKLQRSLLLAAGSSARSRALG